MSGGGPHAPATKQPRAWRNAWTAAQMLSSTAWRFDAADCAGDQERLRSWAETVADPVAAYEPVAVPLPHLDALGAAARREALHGSGLALVRGFGGDDLQLRLCFLALGARIGPILTNYGRLYDVTDRGEDYRQNAVPVSMTREPTSFHTDSSSKEVEPACVALLCLQPARTGGVSLLCSAASVHEALRQEDPEALDRLYRDFARDVVTPGKTRSPDTVRHNRFPIFRLDGARDELVFRYMRYWIERAHDVIGEPLPAADLRALDLLDARLADERFVLPIALQRGDMLFLDNRTIAHNRTAYEDAPDRPRLYVRMWMG